MKINCNNYKVSILTLTLATIFTNQAQAGVSEAINRFFTFREEQKPLVAPDQSLPPIRVITPSYDEQDARKWSKYYTREDLEPQAFMDGSSMVMRPPQPKTKRYNTRKNLNNCICDEQGNPLNGYEVVERREHLNWLEDNSRGTFIGEPGTNPNMDRNVNVNINNKARIGKPIKKWNDSQGDDFASARPGDYNYNRSRNDYEYGGETTVNNDFNQIERSNGYFPFEDDNKEVRPERIGQLRPVENRTGQTPSYNSGDLPASYLVKEQDTLSEISEKENIYGDWKLWPLIYDANRNTIGDDPDLIIPDTNLGIPRNSSEESRRNARERSIEKYPPHLLNDGR